jgi:predicted DNA-binding transcriptional regulator AlpA
MEMASLKTICERYDWKPRTVREWLIKGLFPQPYRHGRLLRWSLQTVDTWAKSKPVPKMTGSNLRTIIRAQ